MYKKQKVVFDELDESIPKVKTNVWRQVSIEPVCTGKKWSSPFEGENDRGMLLKFSAAAVLLLKDLLGAYSSRLSRSVALRETE